MDLGACSKIHSLQLQKEYEDAKEKGKDNYDREMEDVLERHNGECERKITRALRRLEDDDAKAATAISVSKVTKSTEVEDITKQIKQKLKEAKYLDLEGRSDDKIRIMEEVEELRAKRADKQAMLLLEAVNKDKASMPQPVQITPPLAPLPLPVVTDARTQEMIMGKLKKAEQAMDIEFPSSKSLPENYLQVDTLLSYTVTCTSLNGSAVPASASGLMEVQCEVKDESSMLDAKAVVCSNAHSMRNKSLGKSNKLHVHKSDEPISCSQSQQLVASGNLVVKEATQFSALVGRTSRLDDGLQSYKQIPLGQKQIEDPLQARKDADDLIYKLGTKVLQQQKLASTQIKSGSINHGIHSCISLSNLEESVENSELWVFQ